MESKSLAGKINNIYVFGYFVGNIIDVFVFIENTNQKQ